MNNERKPMKTRIMLHNDFHNTRAIILVNEVLDHGLHCEVKLTTSQSDRVRRRLCGLRECLCGGIRGRQDYNGKSLYLNEDWRWK